MNNLCVDLLRKVSTFLMVKDVLLFELSLGKKYHYVMDRETLMYLYHREPKEREVYLRKKDRIVRYVLNSYYSNNILYTKVKSWYRTHPIVSVVTHTNCVSTVEANKWTFHAFADPSKARWKHPLLLKLHVN